MAFVRKVKTASGATAVQIAERVAGRDKVLEHLGSAHTDAEVPGGWSGGAPGVQVRIGMAITLVNVATASVTHGHVCGSRR